MRQVRFEVLNIATKTDITAFLREVVFRFLPEQFVDEHAVPQTDNSTRRHPRSAAYRSQVMLKILPDVGSRYKCPTD